MGGLDGVRARPVEGLVAAVADVVAEGEGVALLAMSSVMRSAPPLAVRVNWINGQFGPLSVEELSLTTSLKRCVTVGPPEKNYGCVYLGMGPHSIIVRWEIDTSRARV